MKYRALPVVLAVLVTMGAAMAENYDVSVDVIPKGLTVGPFEIADYDIHIQNMGDTDTYNIVIEGIPKGWYSLSESEVTVPGVTEKVVYLFITPQDAEKRTYDITVTVNGEAFDSEIVTLNVLPEHELVVIAPASIESCLCEEEGFPVVIKNNGKFTEGVSVEFSGSAKDIVGANLKQVSLDPGETMTIPVAVNALCESEAMDYTLDIMAMSASSYAVASASVDISKTECFGFELSYDENVSACAGYETAAKIMIKNTGEKADTYKIDIEKFEYSDVISLEPGDSRTIEVSIMEIDTGTYEIPFTVSSTHFSREGTISLVSENCYEVDLILDLTNFDILAGTGKLTKPTIKNLGTKGDTFELETDKDWVKVKPNSLQLDSGESEDVYVYYSPEYGSFGEFNVKITVFSDRSEDDEEVNVNVLKRGTETTTQPIVIPPIGNETTTSSSTTLPSFNIDLSGFFSRVFGGGEETNKLVVSIVIGFLAAIVIIILVYLVVMRGA
jgi:uncharacterized membrane protein